MGFTGWLRQHVLGNVVLDVPPELYACEICGESSCTQAKFAMCELRIRTEKVMRPADSNVGAIEVSPGTLPQAVSSGEDEDSSAISGCRAAVRNKPSVSDAQSATTKSIGPEPNPTTRRSVKDT